MSRKFHLSKGQAKILERLGRGVVLAKVNGIYPHYFWHHTIREREVCRIQHKSVSILVDQGLIEDLEKPEWRWRGSQYGITQKGRGLCPTVDTKA